MASSRHYKQFAWQRERQKRSQDYSVLTGTTPACLNGDKNKVVPKRRTGPDSFMISYWNHAPGYETCSLSYVGGDCLLAPHLLLYMADEVFSF